MEEAAARRATWSFSQKLIVALAAVVVVCAGLWYFQRQWKAQDPANIIVDPNVERAINALLEESRTASYSKRVSIFYQIHEIGPTGVPVLVRGLRHEDARVRAFSANLLQYSENIAVTPYLESALYDPNPLVKRSALSALGHLGAFEAVPAIIVVLEDPDNFTRCEAALVLGNLGGDKAVVPLIAMLQNDPYPIARRTAANSLGEIGSEHAVPPLIDSLDDKDVHVRSASRIALNRITGAGLGMRQEDWKNWWNSQRNSAGFR